MKSVTVQANGVRFACLEEGAGPLVLLAHGFPDTPHTWDAVRPALAAAGYRAVSPFMRGYAPTEVPADGLYDSDTLGRDLLALIPALGVESAVVVGHDWGASAAYSAAGLEPARVRMMITVAIPHPASLLPTPRIMWLWRHFVRLRFEGAAAWMQRNDLRYVDVLLQRWSPEWRVPPGESDAAKRAFREPGCLHAVLGYYRALSPIIPPGQRRRVTVPAVAFAGTDDPMPVAAFERARRRFASSYDIVTMPGGHFMHREHPERFIAELLRVLGPP
jgi:pimeloyl-ACP methyl ester carboxylesterase